MDRSAPDPDADDLYARLGLDRTASAKDVKKAFRAAASQYHPDQSEAHRDGRAFRRLCEARDVLSDWLSRHDYDRRTTSEAPPLRAPQAPTGPRDHAPRAHAPRAAVQDAGILDRWEPVFPLVRPWVVLARNAAFVLALVGNAMFLNAALATDPQRLREHWRDLLTWDVLILEVLYVAAPITLHLLSMALITSHRSRSS
jgi:hypothetical protein